jgi:lipopolysaccharide/colanic/teichoic acid biosynthesis glycosyltransferase
MFRATHRPSSGAQKLQFLASAFTHVFGCRPLRPETKNKYTELIVNYLSQIVLKAVSTNIAQISYTLNVESMDRNTLTHLSKVKLSQN